MVTAAHSLFLISDPAGDAEPQVCSGPDASGRCPLAFDGEPVPCAGRTVILLSGDVPAHWSLSVSAAEDECPLPIMCAGGG